MKKVTIIIIIFFFFFTGCSSHNEVGPIELTVSAASSLQMALNEIIKIYESKHENVKIVLNMASSGSLQQQIERGAPVDLYLSASGKHMQALIDQQLVDAQQQVLLSNELVIIVPINRQLKLNSLKDLLNNDIKLIALGIPESVPAGQYAWEALVHSGLWEDLKSKVVQTKDSRQVLHYVETANADVGFAYRTDANTSAKVNIAFTLDSSMHSPIQYVMGIVRTTNHPKQAKHLYNYLQSEDAINFFKKYGYSVPR